MLNILLIFASVIVVGCSEYGFLPTCPGVEQPLHLTAGVLSRDLFYTAQVHYPWLTYRKRYFYGRALRSIGTDPNIDFRNRKTMLYLDGYLDSTHFPLARAAIGSYAARGYNAFSVDAQKIYAFAYPLAARAAIQVGNATGLLLSRLMDYGLKAEDIELVGLSLGGQVVSFVAKFFKFYSGRRVGKIVSLDPSGPCFRLWGPDQRLSQDDADFVQVIHTNNEGYGMGDAQGHVDFYINGGEFQQVISPYQPWCEEFLSHGLSIIYYYTSFVKYAQEFVGVKCNNVQQAREHRCYDNVPPQTNVLGPGADPGKPGIYYVPVGAFAPFFAPKDFIERRLNYPLEYNDAFSVLQHFVLGQ